MTSKRKSRKASSPAADLARAIQHVAAAATEPATVGHRCQKIKSWPEHFAASAAGLKPFEVRKNDRDFRVGDRITLREWIPLGGDEGVFTGREIEQDVIYIARNAIGLQEGYVAMGVQLVAIGVSA